MGAGSGTFGILGLRVAEVRIVQIGEATAPYLSRIWRLDDGGSVQGTGDICTRPDVLPESRHHSRMEDGNTTRSLRIENGEGEAALFI